MFFSIAINAQKKKPRDKVSSANATHVETVSTIQMDSTASFTIYAEGNFLTFSKDGYFASLDSTGKKIWEQHTAGSILVKPVVSENTVVIATDNNEINTFDLKTGTQLQSIGTEQSITTPLLVFNYSGSNELMISKETDSKSALVFGMANGKISCIDLETLQEYWQNIDQKDSLFIKPISINNKLVFTRGDGSLNCIDANTGLLIWRWIGNELSNFSKSRLKTDGRSIFVVSADSIFHSINFMLGRLNWRLENAKTVPEFFYSPSRNNLYLLHKNEKLIIFSVREETGIDDFRLRNNLKNNSYHFFEYNRKVFFVYNGAIYEATEKLALREILKLDFAQVKVLFEINTNTFAALGYNGKLTIFRMR